MWLLIAMQKQFSRSYRIMHTLNKGTMSVSMLQFQLGTFKMLPTSEAVAIAPPFSYREKLSQKPHFWPIVLGNIFVSSRDFWRVFGKKVKDKQGLVD